MREKLIELLDVALFSINWDWGDCPNTDELADYLIAFAKDNNVPSKWISVKDRLPDRDDMVIAFYPTMRGTSGEMQIHKAWAISDTCTHWMPLPEPPKEDA